MAIPTNPSLNEEWTNELTQASHINGTVNGGTLSLLLMLTLKKTMLLR